MAFVHTKEQKCDCCYCFATTSLTLPVLNREWMSMNMYLQLEHVGKGRMKVKKGRTGYEQEIYPNHSVALSPSLDRASNQRLCICASMGNGMLIIDKPVAYDKYLLLRHTIDIDTAFLQNRDSFGEGG